MKVTVKTKPGQVCRLTESLCVGESPAHVELTSMVRRRLRDGSLIKVDESKEKEPEKVTQNKALEKKESKK